MLPVRLLLLGALLTSVTPAQTEDRPTFDPADVPAPPIDHARFDELRALLRPDPDAPWRSVPWRIDLLAAQREAVAGNRPLFIWAMDGHPLGCT